MRLILNLTVIVAVVVGLVYATVAWACLTKFSEVMTSVDGGAGRASGLRRSAPMTEVHRYFMGGAALVIVIPGLALALLLKRRVVNPIDRLSRTAAEIGSGRLDQSPTHWPKDEIGDLGRSIEQMRSALSSDKQMLMESEREKRQFYRNTIFAVTGGRLVLCEREEIIALLGEPRASVFLGAPEDLEAVRRMARLAVHEIGMNEERTDSLVLSVGEAAENALKHAHGANVSAYIDGRVVRLSIADEGSGIDTLIIPKATLERGFSTKVSLGMGYSLMLELADKVYLATGKAGTMVVIEMAAEPPSEGPGSLISAWEAI
ncbi:MAG: HAMP domain-containing protein [Armatimonadota bacterium]|nr:HAMP domain-containing protein [Armatimonadota bacterium]